MLVENHSLMRLKIYAEAFFSSIQKEFCINNIIILVQVQIHNKYLITNFLQFLEHF